MIPMIDLRGQFQDIRQEVLEALEKILDDTHFILGPSVTELEQKIATYHGVEHAVGVASGTDALHLALKALGIEEGDEVITTPFTFFATVEAIMYTGATPVFADIEPDTFNIDVASIREKITPRTKALLPVHMFGYPADMEAITALAMEHGLKVIEDNAQAFGASIGGQKTGGFGDAGCMSFYPSKNLGACGDGGMAVFKDQQVAERVRSLRNHGSVGPYQHGCVGLNSRLDEIQAAILLIKLKRIDEYNKKRAEIAGKYTSLLSPVVACPIQGNSWKHVYHQYTIRSPRRDEIKASLRQHEIASTVYYPTPLHFQKPLKPFGYKEGDFPVAEQACKEVLSLPIYPEMKDSDLQRIASIINSV